MTTNIDKFVTDSEHALINHAGLPGVGGGVSAFTDLSDTPAGPLTNTSLFRVDGGGNLVEFTTPNISWIPETGSLDLGSAANPWQAVHASGASHTTGNGTVTLPAAGTSHLVVGDSLAAAGGTATISAVADSVILGSAYGYGGGGTGTIQTQSKGAVVFGHAYGYYGPAIIHTTAGAAIGALVGGYAYSGLPAGGGTAEIRASRNGQIAIGYASTDNTGSATLSAGSTSDGTATIGFSTVGTTGLGNALLESGGGGSFTSGMADHDATGNASSIVRIRATARGARAHGRVEGAPANITHEILASGIGSLAIGDVYGATSTVNTYITASASGAWAFGSAENGGRIQSSGLGAGAFGRAEDCALGKIHSEQPGSLTFGVIENCNTLNRGIRSIGDGGLAFGRVDGDGLIYSDASGLAFGRSTSGGIIFSDENSMAFGDVVFAGATIENDNLFGGSLAHGRVQGGAGTLKTDSIGCHGHGRVAGAGLINAAGHGSTAHGQVLYDSATSFIRSGGVGSLVFGYVKDGAGADGQINTTTLAHGSLVFGSAYGGTIESIDAEGVLVGGVSYSTFGIRSSAFAAMAFGYAYGGDILVTAGNAGSLAFGYAYAYDISVSGLGALAFGYSDSAVISATANNAWQFGPGTNATAGSLQIGANVSFRVSGNMALSELGSAPTGESDKALLFAEDNGGGKTRLMVQFGTGAAQQVAIEP